MSKVNVRQRNLKCIIRYFNFRFSHFISIAFLNLEHAQKLYTLIIELIDTRITLLKHKRIFTFIFTCAIIHLEHPFYI